MNWFVRRKKMRKQRLKAFHQQQDDRNVRPRSRLSFVRFGRTKLYILCITSGCDSPETPGAPAGVHEQARPAQGSYSHWRDERCSCSINFFLFLLYCCLLFKLLFGQLRVHILLFSKCILAMGKLTELATSNFQVHTFILWILMIRLPFLLDLKF